MPVFPRSNNKNPPPQKGSGILIWMLNPGGLI